MAAGTKTSRHAAERQRVIIDAARACFLQFGYAKTSMDDIAKRAGISRPLVYRAFANKEAIFASVYEATFETRYPAALAIAEGRGSKRERLLRCSELLVLGPWEEIHDSPMLAEYYSACEALLPEEEAKHARKQLAIAKAILGDREQAELFLLAIGGLSLDLPNPATLRRRVRLLVDRFV